MNGRKRPILVDTIGNLLKVVAHSAHVGDRVAALYSSCAVCGRDYVPAARLGAACAVAVD